VNALFSGEAGRAAVVKSWPARHNTPATDNVISNIRFITSLPFQLQLLIGNDRVNWKTLQCSAYSF
jgi:hypothetical protein